jgi:hypothetical protein
LMVDDGWLWFMKFFRNDVWYCWWESCFTSYTVTPLNFAGWWFGIANSLGHICGGPDLGALHLSWNHPKKTQGSHGAEEFYAKASDATALVQTKERAQRAQPEVFGDEQLGSGMMRNLVSWGIILLISTDYNQQ